MGHMRVYVSPVFQVPTESNLHFMRFVSSDVKIPLKMCALCGNIILSLREAREWKKVSSRLKSVVGGCLGRNDTVGWRLIYLHGACDTQTEMTLLLAYPTNTDTHERAKFERTTNMRSFSSNFSFFFRRTPIIIAPQKSNFITRTHNFNTFFESTKNVSFMYLYK